jgi:hypothetical protein
MKKQNADFPDLPVREAVARRHHGNQENQRSIFIGSLGTQGLTSHDA